MAFSVLELRAVFASLQVGCRQGVHKGGRGCLMVPAQKKSPGLQAPPLERRRVEGNRAGIVMETKNRPEKVFSKNISI